ncbi:R3H domain-containing protein 1 [Apiospora sp. TS-2023a]
MATVGTEKLSFAKVAASGAKENMPPSTVQRVAVPASTENRRISSAGTPAGAAKTPAATAPKAVSPTVVAKSAMPHGTPEAAQKESRDQRKSTDATVRITQNMNDLSISSKAVNPTSTPSLVVNGSSNLAPGDSHSKVDITTAVSDEVSQRADSNSEIGTKAPSLDGKSITSGTTFALDEKESLRPDDSASVKAAEDDEAFSVRGSQMTASRMGSEIARVHRLRLGDMPEKRIIQLLPEVVVDQGVVTPQSNSSGVPPPAEKQQILASVSQNPDAFNSMYAQNPDEKLLEAMASPKDRLFLLRLEQDVINFVQSSKEPYMDLPPNNSFCRMLTHKLADYYHMTHSFEAVQGAVRIYRTPFCRVPPSLASIVGTAAETNTSSTPPVLLPKKIMRRGEDSGNGSSPSKGTSEVGSDGEKKNQGINYKLTREQREEAYNKARERIFGNTEKIGESTPETEDANGMSRASSVSGKEKSNVGRRGKTGKQRRDDSESFDSRSQYTPYYGTNPNQPSWAQTGQYVAVGNMPYNGQMQQPYQAPMPQGYPQAGPAYPQMMPQGPMSGYPPIRLSLLSLHSNATRRVMRLCLGTAHPCSPHLPSLPGSNSLLTRLLRPPFQRRTRNQQLGVRNPKATYNRHAFNPKTQSFVPSNGMNHAQPPMAPYSMGGPHGSPQIGSPHMNYNGYSSPAPQSYMGGAPSYGMSRQSSNQSLPAYHPHATPPQHMQQHPATHMSPMPSQMNSHMPQQMGHHMQHKNMGMPQPMNGHNHQPGYSTLPNYGNPATLPQKPPTGTS